MDSEYSFELIKNYFTIEEKNGYSIQLNHIKWGNNEPKYDIRRWKDGKPLKGLSMNSDSLKYLCKAMAIIAARSGIADSELNGILQNKAGRHNYSRKEAQRRNRRSIFEDLNQPQYRENNCRIEDVIYDSFVRNYLRRNGIGRLSELVKVLSDGSIQLFKGFTEYKENVIYESLEAYIRSPQKEFVSKDKTVLNEFSEIYKNLPIESLRLFLRDKRAIEKLQMNGFRKVGELVGIEETKLEYIIGQNSFNQFLAIEETLKNPPEIILTEIWEKRMNSRDADIVLKRAKGYSLNAIGREEGLTRERIRQIAGRFYDKQEPFLSLIKDKVNSSENKNQLLLELFPKQNCRLLFELWAGIGPEVRLVEEDKTTERDEQPREESPEDNTELPSTQPQNSEPEYVQELHFSDFDIPF